MKPTSPILNIADAVMSDNGGDGGRYATQRARITNHIGMQKLACSLYPDSKKIGALASGFADPVRYFADQNAAVDYYKGET